MDKAIAFSLLTRIWQASAGLVTLLLIAQHFAPDIQGYFYTFLSLLALQSFVELGLYLVVVNLASHEWSKLSLDDSGRIIGDKTALSRLGSLMRFIVRYYSAASLLFVLGVGIGGHLFLSLTESSIAWQAPWWTVVALAAIQLWLMPIQSLLEGCNQVLAVNRFRLVQTVLDALVMWSLLALGAGLWTSAGSLAIKVAATLVFFTVSYRQFFRSLWTGLTQASIEWTSEIWPMQWRLAAQGAVNYLVFSLFNPIMFHYHGPEAAGRMGMTLQVISVVQLMALSWIQTKVPTFGMLVAKRQYEKLDCIWGQASRQSFGFAVVGSLAIWLAIFALGYLDLPLASRLLEPLPTALFLIANLIMLITNYYAAYLRAHAREPFLLVGVLGGLLMGTLVFLLSRAYGPVGAGAAYLGALALFALPLTTFIWIRSRAEWQDR